MPQAFTVANLKRAADRAAMRDDLERLARGAGAVFTVDFEKPREIYLTIELNGVRAYVSLDACDQSFMCSWVSERHLSGAFPGGLVNEFHGRKATTVDRQWSRFCSTIQRSLASVVDGSAFTEEQ